MPLWGNSTADESKPKYILAANIGKHYDPNKLYATAAGWEITHENGLNELLVAIPGLSTSLGASDVVALEWGGNFYGAGTATVIVCYNEEIVVTGHPTLVVTKSTGGTITATHVSNSKNRLVFSFTVTDGLATILSIGAQDIGLNGGSLTDADGTTSNVAISAPIAAAIYPTATKTITLDNPVSATWEAGTFVKNTTGKTLTVVYDSAVTVVGSKTIATLWSGVAGPTGPVATYASGSGTNTLVFTLATIPNEAGTLSIATQTIGGAGTMKDANGTTVNYVISAGIATATGTKVVAA